MSTILDLINVINTLRNEVVLLTKEKDEEIRQLKAKIEILNVKKQED